MEAVVLEHSRSHARYAAAFVLASACFAAAADGDSALGTVPAPQSGRWGRSAALMQNFPNPFATQTTIPLLVKRAVHVTLTVYSESGREILTLLDRVVCSGRHNLKWTIRGLPQGVYVLRLRADHEEQITTFLIGL
jgi:hypothetical protein